MWEIQNYVSSSDIEAQATSFDSLFAVIGTIIGYLTMLVYCLWYRFFQQKPFRVVWIGAAIALVIIEVASPLKSMQPAAFFAVSAITIGLIWAWGYKGLMTVDLLPSDYRH